MAPPADGAPPGGAAAGPPAPGAGSTDPAAPSSPPDGPRVQGYARRAERAADPERAGDVRLEHPYPFRFRQLQARALAGDAGGAHQYVEAVKLLQAGVAQAFECQAVGHVGRLTQRAAAAGLDLAGHFIDERLSPAGRDDVRARIREPQRDGPADAARAADDHGDTAAQTEEGHRAIIG